jgi:hypothetical protein
MNTPSSAALRRRLASIAILGLWVAASTLPVAPAGAQELGRLFLTPQQRKDLEARRQGQQADAVETQPVVEPLVTVNGRVTRSSGRTTTWINGVPEDDVYRSADPARVPIQGGGIRVPVKVGQTLDRSRGEVRDAVQGGEIRVPAAADR